MEEDLSVGMVVEIAVAEAVVGHLGRREAVVDASR